MSAQPEERDAAVVRWIAAYLDVELTPWQSEFLQTMMCAHRLGRTPVVAVRGPYGLCDAPFVSGITCERARGHADVHEAGQPGTNGYRRWE